MEQAEQQKMLDLSQQEIVNVSKLPVGTPIKIGDNVIWFTSPANHVTTFNKLIEILKQYPSYPCIIFSPEFEDYPEYTSMISNYIIRKAFPDAAQTTTVKRLVTEETVANFFQSHTQVTESEMREVLLVDKRKAVLTQLNALEAEFHELNIKMKNNALTPEEYDRGNDLYMNQIPALKKQFEQATTELADFITERNSLCKNSNPVEIEKSADARIQTTAPMSETTLVSDAVEPTVSLHPEGDKVPASTVQPADDKWTRLGLVPQTPYATSCREVTANWQSSELFFMPWTIAVQMANSPAYAQYKEQQVDCNGYAAVPLAYLLVYQIPLYLDGLPVVFSSDGEFMRIGNSEYNSTDRDYWYPKPHNLIEK